MIPDCSTEREQRDCMPPPPCEPAPSGVVERPTLPSPEPVSGPLGSAADALDVLGALLEPVASDLPRELCDLLGPLAVVPREVRTELWGAVYAAQRALEEARRVLARDTETGGRGDDDA